jgi:hypothetical protein
VTTIAAPEAITAAFLAQCGEALFGPNWKAALIESLGLNERKLRRILGGTTPIPVGLVADLGKLIHNRAASLEDLLDQLDAIAPGLAPAPDAPVEPVVIPPKSLRPHGANTLRLGGAR